MERLPPALRMPNSRFVAVVEGGELLRVEKDGRTWLEIQNRIREVLNTEWDPIGGGVPEDEYDSYIAEIYSMLQRDASAEDLAERLLRIETDEIGLDGLPVQQRLEVGRRLKALDLPGL